MRAIYRWAQVCGIALIAGLLAMCVCGLFVPAWTRQMPRDNERQGAALPGPQTHARMSAAIPPPLAITNTPATSSVLPVSRPSLSTPRMAGRIPRAVATAAHPSATQPLSQEDSYAQAPILDEKTGPLDANGRYERVRVYRTDMKYPFVRVVDVMVRSGTPALAGQNEAAKDILVNRTEMVADHVTVKLKEGVREADLAATIAADDGKILRKLRVPGPGTYLVQLPDAKVDAIPIALANLARKPGVVATAHPDYVVHTSDTIPNDPLFGQLWGMKNTGQVPQSTSIVAGNNAYSGICMTYSPTTPANGITATLYACGYGAAGDFPASGTGYIALMQRGATNGTLTFADKVTNAKAAGAVAAIIYNNVSGDFSGTLGAAGDWLPTVGVSDTTGAALMGMTNSSVTLTILPAPIPGDIRATTAWDRSTGNREILVGVIDTGIDYNHEDLKDNIWVNAGETGLDASGHDRRNNGIDDDGNGYIDDWHGWDFCNNDNNPMDDHFHGTHCAGTIGGVGNNLTGVAGVCWKVSLVGLKFLSIAGSGFTSDATEAIYYATRIGVKLTSNSWGGGPFDPDLYAAVDDAGKSNILFVAAAGNDGADNDGTPNYPSNFSCTNLVAVAATDSGDNLANFSNYGLTTVDLGAPGVNILSCQPGNKYQLLNGTSMATPHVAGACALAWSRSPFSTAAQIKECILSAVDPIPALQGRCLTGGRLNIAKLGLTNVLLLDWSIDDTLGNNDGVINPGETINLSLTFRNTRTNTATGVHASLAALTNGAVLSGEANLGTLTNGATVLGAFQVRVDNNAPTPGNASFLVTITDDAGGLWPFPVTLPLHRSTHVTGTATLDGTAVAGVTVTFDGLIPAAQTTDALGHYAVTLVEGAYAVSATKTNWLSAVSTLSATASVMTLNFAFNTATISGHVRDALTANPVTGATIVVVSPFSQSVTTDVNGAYTLTRVYGQTTPVILIARKSGVYSDSAPRTVTVPPDAPGTDFLLGIPDIHVQPLSFDVHVELPDMTNQTLTIGNSGGSGLKWTIRNAMDAIPARVARAGALMRTWSIGTNTINGSYPVKGAAFDGTALWVCDTFTTTLKKLDPLDGHLIGTLDLSAVCPPNSRVQGPAWDGTNLWFAGNPNSQWKLFAINPSNGQLIKTFPVPNGVQPDSMAIGGGVLWFTKVVTEEGTTTTWTGSNYLYQVDLDTGFLLKTLVMTQTHEYLSGLAYFNGSLWTSLQSNGLVRAGSLYKLSPDDGTVVSRFANVVPQNSIGAITSDGKHGLWMFQEYGYSTHPRPAFLIDSGAANWLQAIPDHGMVSAPSTSQVTVAFDSVAVGPGVFHATMNLDSNDPLHPRVPVDVTFTVTSPFSISGTVTLDGQPLGGATVQYDGPYPGSVQSDQNGNYSFYAATGTYTVVAGKGNYLASAPVAVTVGPSRTGVNFAFTTATISGTARDFLTSAPVSGATIVYNGPITGSVQTTSGGAYSITRVYGQTATLNLTAKKAGVYNDSDSQAVTVPPNRTGIDFSMGNSAIGLTPASFTNVEVPVGTVLTQTLTIANTGSAPLKWSTWSAVAASQGAGAVSSTLSLTNTVGTMYGIAFDGSALWVNYNQPYLYKLDPKDGTLLAKITMDLPSFESIWGSAWDGSNLWVAGRSTKRVYVVNRATGATILSFPTPDGIEPSGIAVGGGYLWVLTRYDSNLPLDVRRIYKMSPADGSPQGWIETPPGMSTASLYALTYFNGALWTSEFRSLFDDIQTSTMFKLNPADGTVLSSFTAPNPQTIGLSSDCMSRLWAINNDSAVNTKAYTVDSGEVLWLRTAPPSGKVPVVSSTNISLVFDATMVAKGTYTAAVHVASNDRQHPDVAVPVVMKVVNATLIEVDQTSVSVPEGGTASFRVRLSKLPRGTVTVAVARSAGDTDITVQSGANLTFTTDNWNTYQTAVLAAAEDADTLNGSATVVCSAAGVNDVIVTATETDNDTVLRVYTGPGGVVSPVGSMVVTKGAAVPVSAVANANYVFGRWFATEGTAIVSSPNASNTTVTITAPTTIQAYFVAGTNPFASAPWAWGDNSKGQLGDGTTAQRTIAVQVLGVSNVTAITAGFTHTVALKNDGAVWAWGYNYYGQLGDGTTTQRNTPVQVKMSGGSALSNITVIAAGRNGYHSLAIGNDKTVWAWGSNASGQLGDGTTTQRTNAVPVKMSDGSALSNVTAIAAGGNHTLAIGNDKTVWAWGINHKGQLGDGTTTQRNAPVQVKMPDGSALSNITAITAGSTHTVALRNDGTVWAWGENVHGELGDGTTTQRNRPMQVKMSDGSAFSNVTAIVAGGMHTVAIKNDGTLWAWGYNYYGQLGIGTTEYPSNPVPVRVSDGSTLSNVTAVAAGWGHTVALQSDGSVWASGWNVYGQLGNGTTRDSLWPVHLTNLVGVSSIAAGTYHTLALRYPFVEPLSPFWYLTVAKTGNGWTLPETGTWPVPVGNATNVLLVADDWYRIQSLTTNTVTVSVANPRSNTVAIAAMPANQTNAVAVSFYQPLSLGGKFGTVLPSWLSKWGTENGVLANLHTNDFALGIKYLLNIDPTTTETVNFQVDTIAVDGGNVQVVTKLLIDNGPHPAINGNLRLYGCDVLSNNCWAAAALIASTNVTPPGAVFNAQGKASFLFAVGPATNKFYQARIE